MLCVMRIRLFMRNIIRKIALYIVYTKDNNYE